MARMRLTDKADPGLMYDAEVSNWSPEFLKQAGVTREKVIAFFSSCPSVGFEIDGKQVGGMIFDGKEAHLAVLPEYQGRWALLFKHALNWLFSIKDPVYVDIQATNEKCIRFMERNQWRRVKENSEKITFEMTRNTPVLTREWKRK